MSIESGSDGDGSDIFWPGYVDAVTNLVLNLLFLLTIMTVAVFMFAMELGRQNHSPVEAVTEVLSTPNPVKTDETEVEALRKQVKLLKQEVLAANELLSPQKVLSASSSIPRPEKSIDRTSASGGGVVVRFTAEAVALNTAEADRLRGTLGPVVASGGARIDVLVPTGFSEAKRLGFYRAMAVRNLLIEMKVPPKRIDVSVREGAASADATQVRVMPR